MQKESQSSDHDSAMKQIDQSEKQNNHLQENQFPRRPRNLLDEEILNTYRQSYRKKIVEISLTHGYNLNLRLFQTLWQKILKKSKRQIRRTSDDQILRQIEQMINDSMNQQAVGEVIESAYHFLKDYRHLLKIYYNKTSNYIDIQINLGKISNRDAVHVYGLSNLIKNYLQGQLKFTDQRLQISEQEVITHIQEIFQSLTQCLYTFLKKYVQEKRTHKLGTLNYMFFPRSFKKYPPKFDSKSIYIAGLKHHCKRFLRALMIVIFEHTQILQQNIKQRAKDQGRQQTKQFGIIMKKVSKFIQQKYSQMLMFHQSNSSQLKRIKDEGEIKNKIHPDVIDNFYEQVRSLNIQNLYSSQQSQKIYNEVSQCYLLNKESKIRLTGPVNLGDKPNLINIKIKGFIIRHKRSEQNCKNKNIDLNKLRRQEQLHQLFPEQKQLDQEDAQNELYKQKIFVGSNPKTSINIVLNKNGSFCLIKSRPIINSQKAIEQLESILYDQLLKLLDYQYHIQNKQFSYCYKGILDYSKFDMESFREVYKNQGLKNKCRKRNFLKYYQDFSKRLNTYENTQNNRYYNQPNPNILNSFQDYVSLENYYYKNSLDKMNKKKSKRVFDVCNDENNYCHFRINSPDNLKQVLFFLQTIYEEIDQHIKTQTALNHEQKMEQKIFLNYSQIKLAGLDPNISPFYERTTPKIPRQVNLPKNDNVHVDFDPSKRNYIITPLKTQIKQGMIGLKQIYLYQFSILIWNIQGARHKVDPLNNKEYFLQWVDERIKQIVQHIRQFNAQFICIQEAEIIPKKYKDIFFSLLCQNSEGKPYYFSQLDVKEFNGDVTKRQSRSIILSVIPVKFYDIHFSNLSSKNMTFCEFQIHVKGQKCSTIMFSIHLKANQGNTWKDRDRQAQLKTIKEISQKFDIIILAGDFNIVPQPKCKYGYISELQSFYRDLDEFFNARQKPFTFFSKGRDPQRFDRILMKIKDGNLNDKLDVIPKQVGKGTCYIYEDVDFKTSNIEGQKTGLSDHYGRFDKIRFSR